MSHRKTPNDPEFSDGAGAGARADSSDEQLEHAQPSPPLTTAAEPPVVARLVVEIRSDGSHTIARGALEDAISGQKVAVEARGSSPFQLALAMAKSMFKTPVLAKKAVRGLLPGRGRRSSGRRKRSSSE